MRSIIVWKIVVLRKHNICGQECIVDLELVAPKTENDVFYLRLYVGIIGAKKV